MAFALVCSAPVVNAQTSEDAPVARSPGSQQIRINRVAFEGNSKLKGEQLETIVKLKTRGSFDAATAQADVQRIQEVYRRNGRSAATVSYREVRLDDGRIDVVYTINEGDKTGIKSINFVGNNAVSSSRLRRLIDTTE